MNPWILALAAWNALTLLVYGWDKWCAIRGARRVSEARLLGLAAALGALGAWGGVFLFRHKRSKASFLRRLVLVTLLDVAVVGGVAWWRLAP